jgi:hypothetical protein
MYKSNMFRLFKKQSGQALLIVVLVLVVALTVGLSVASRSIINLKNSQNQASSQKALSAAEAGVELALKSQNQTTVAGGFGGTGITNYQTTVSSISGQTQFLIHGNNDQVNLIKKGNPAYIWTTNYSAGNPWAGPWSGTLTISWGDAGGSCANNSVAALEIQVISGSTADYKTAALSLQRFAYDPCLTISNRGNGFDGAISGSSFTNPALSYHITLPTISNIYLASVNPSYADTHVGVSTAPGNTALPSQGVDINSIGTDNQVQRRTFVYQGFPQLPACLFSYTICSP